MTAQPAIKTRLIATVGAFSLYEHRDGHLSLARNGENPIASAWGPAADNDNWFAWRAGTDPIRVESRDAAIEYITAPVLIEENA